MSREDAVTKVIEILIDKENTLSDGFIFYYPDAKEGVEEHIKDIAEEIVNSIHLLLF